MTQPTAATNFVSHQKIKNVQKMNKDTLRVLVSIYYSSQITTDASVANKN